MKYLLYGKRAGILAITIMLVLFGMVSIAGAANHQVTVTVAPIEIIVIQGGDITLTIDTPDLVGEDYVILPAINTACKLIWLTNRAGRQITVGAVLAGGDLSQDFTLTVAATGATAGSPAGEVGLIKGAAALPFITAVGKTRGKCTLTYTASATEAVEEGTSDILTVTYTIVAG